MRADITRSGRIVHHCCRELRIRCAFIFAIDKPFSVTGRRVRLPLTYTVNSLFLYKLTKHQIFLQILYYSTIPYTSQCYKFHGQTYTIVIITAIISLIINVISVGIAWCIRLIWLWILQKNEWVMVPGVFKGVTGNQLPIAFVIKA